MSAFSPDSSQQKVMDCRQNLCVVAGAGSGKTGTLVAGLTARLQRGYDGLEPKLRVPNILALTFTDKAAAELRGRLAESFRRRRRELQKNLASARLDRQTSKSERRAKLEQIGQEINFWRDQEAELALADIGTIHGYALKLVREGSLFLGLSPGLAVEEDETAFERDLKNILVDWLESRDQNLIELLNFYSLTELTTLLGQAVRRLAAWGFDRPRVDLDDSPNKLAPHMAALKRATAEAWAFIEAGGLDPKKNYSARVRQALVDFQASLEPPAADPAEKLPLWRSLLKQSSIGGGHAFNEYRKALETILDQITAWQHHLLAIPAKKAFAALTGQLPERLAARKSRRGVINFDDILILARRLLAEAPEIRREQINKYQVIVVDEFQDTNRLQADLLAWLLIEADDHKSYPADNRPWSGLPWSGLAPRFSVYGDLKQSIYRFRGAEVKVMGDLRASLGPDAGRVLALDVNYRSQNHLVNFFNAFFPDYLGPDFYDPRLDRQNPNRPVLYGDRPLTWLQGPDRPKTMGERISLEANMLTTYLARLFSGQTPVRVGDREGRPRLPRPGDVAVLFRRALYAPVFQKFLIEAGWPCRLISADDPFEAAESKGLLSTFCFLAGLDRDLHLAGLLRSPLGPISDEGLGLLARPEPGPVRPLSLYFGPQAPAWPASLSQDDRAGLERLRAMLRELAPLAGRRPPAEIMELIIERSRLIPLAMTAPDGAGRVRSLQKILSLARGLGQNAEHNPESPAEELLTLWRNGQKNEKPDESDGPEECIQLMTVHRAKGLEFPVVVMAEADYAPSRRSSKVLIDPNENMALSFTSNAHEKIIPFDYLEIKESETAAAAEESRRLLYVAATRARDHLVILGWPTPTKSNGEAGAKRGWLDDLLEFAAAETFIRTETTDPTLGPPSGPPPESKNKPRPLAESPPPRLATGPAAPLGDLRLSVTALTRFLADPEAFYQREYLGLEESSGDDLMPAEPFQTGSAPADLGNIFHGVLEKMTFQEGEAIPDLIGLEAQNRGLCLRGNDLIFLGQKIEQFHQSSLGRDYARARAQGLYTAREMPFWLEEPAPDRRHHLILNGVMDLFFVSPGGYGQIVDYKLARFRPGSSGLAAYEAQLRIYAQAIETAGFNKPVKAAIYFAGDEKPIIHEVALEETPIKPLLSQLHRLWPRLAALRPCRSLLPGIWLD